MFQKKKLFIILIIFVLLLSIIGSNLIKDFIFPTRRIDKIQMSKINTSELRTSKISEKIHIDNNWTETKIAGICTGQGTYSDPYVIEDLVIDGGGSSSCIFIENSIAVFRIENCTVYNSGNFSHAGIKLSNVTYSFLKNNNCSSNNIGLYLNSSSYCYISGNIINDNIRDGIYMYNSKYSVVWEKNTINNNYYGIGIYFSNYNFVLNNTLNNNIGDGVFLYYSHYNNFSGNNLNGSGFEVHGSLKGLATNNIYNTNLVNGKPLYYFTNETNLGPSDFENAGQVILVNCNDSIISNLDITYSSNGISLYYCYNNIILKNNVEHNTEYGIYLFYSNDNTISENIANNNRLYGIYIYQSNNNYILGNIANNNNGFGISLHNCDANNVSLNTANNNWVGIYLCGSNRSSVLENIAKNNKYGIYLYLSNNNTISGNKLSTNKKKAIEEIICKGNIIKDTIIRSDFPLELIALFLIFGIVAILFLSGLIVWKKKVSLPIQERREKKRLKEMERKEKKRIKEEKNLEKERIKEEKERLKIEEQKLIIEQDLKRRLNFVDNLIKDNKFEIALQNINEIQEIAESHNLNLILLETEKKLVECKKTQVETINRIKQIIGNLSSKFARLQIADISEKSEIKDEVLIEKIILEMIKSKEIQGEYFASSKALALEVGAPISIEEAEKTNILNIFLSYSTLDTDHFEISRIVRRLKLYPEIMNVFFWEADSGENIVEYMEKTLKETNVFVLFCSENSIRSKSVEGEWQAAYQLRKEGLMKIVPVYEREEDIPYLLKPILNVRFTKEKFDDFIEKLYKEILR